VEVKIDKRKEDIIDSFGIFCVETVHHNHSQRIVDYW